MAAVSKKIYIKYGRRGAIISVTSGCDGGDDDDGRDGSDDGSGGKVVIIHACITRLSLEFDK